MFRPGYLDTINTIHFARWVLLPGANRLMFFSNYGGSWESYLEDFIAKAASGLTGVWSNTEGYPRTRWLFLDGARDGDRFKRWARRQQVPTLFWYSAYPDLNTARIRINSQDQARHCGRHGKRGARLAEPVRLHAAAGRRTQGRLPPTSFRPGLTPVEHLETGEIQSIFFSAIRFAGARGTCWPSRVPDGLPRRQAQGVARFRREPGQFWRQHAAERAR